LSSYSKFKDLVEDFMDDHDGFYKSLYFSEDVQSFKMKDKWSHLNSFEKICLIKCFRPDKMCVLFGDLISEQLGEYYTKPLEFDLNNIEAFYEDTKPKTPIIFIQNDNQDPIEHIHKLSEMKKRFTDVLELNKESNFTAEKIILKAVQKGRWIVLKNIHYAPK